MEGGKRALVFRRYKTSLHDLLASTRVSGQPTGKSNLLDGVQYSIGYPLAFRLQPRDQLRIAEETAMGLQYIHTKGVVHRDVAARNILVDEDNSVKLADLGMAKYDASQHHRDRQIIFIVA